MDEARDLAVPVRETPKLFGEKTKLKGMKLGQEYRSRRSLTPAAAKQGFCFLQLGLGQNRTLTNDTLETRLTWSGPMADKGPRQPD